MFLSVTPLVIGNFTTKLLVKFLELLNIGKTLTHFLYI